MIETHGCLRMLDDLKNGRPRAPIEPQKGQDVKKHGLLMAHRHGLNDFFNCFFVLFFQW